MGVEVYPYGSQTIAVPDTQSIAVQAIGDNAALVYQDVGYPNLPSAWRQIGTVLNTETVFGPYTPAASIRIEAGANPIYYEVGATPVVGEPIGNQVAGVTPWTTKGLDAAQGGSVGLTGGTSSTAGNAGGAVINTGGVPGATGIGGAVGNTGGAGGATSGAGGAAVNRGGAGTAGNSAGGVANNIGGAGQGSAAGGVANNTGGLAGATGIGGAANNVGGAGGATSGKGGLASSIGGAATAGNTDGGGSILGGGAKSGTGFIGPVILGNAQLTPIWSPQAAPAADGGDTPFTATVAQLVAGLISMTPTTGRAITTPTGAEMDAGVAFADVPATFGFDFTVQNRAAFAATDDIITLTAGATGITVTGTATVAPGVAGRFRAVRTTTATWIIYKIAG